MNIFVGMENTRKGRKECCLDKVVKTGWLRLTGLEETSYANNSSRTAFKAGTVYTESLW